MKLLKGVLGLLLALSTQACGGKETPPLATTELLQKLPRVENSPQSPCWQQRQIASQNAFMKEALERQQVTYKAPCDIDPPPVAKPAAKPAPVRTSRAPGAREGS